MKLLRLLSVLLLFSSLGALAQVGVYAEFSAAKLNVPNSTWIYGPTFGAYYDPIHFVIGRAGVDARGSILGGSGSTQLQSGLIGPRVVLTPHVLPFMPYVEGLIGAGHTRFTEPYQTSGTATVDNMAFEYQFVGGVDMTVLPRIDWRIAEFSFGGVNGSASSFGGIVTSINPKTLSTGIVIRLP